MSSAQDLSPLDAPKGIGDYGMCHYYIWCYTRYCTYYGNCWGYSATMSCSAVVVGVYWHVCEARFGPS